MGGEDLAVRGHGSVQRIRQEVYVVNSVTRFSGVVEHYECVISRTGDVRDRIGTVFSIGFHYYVVRQSAVADNGIRKFVMYYIGNKFQSYCYSESKMLKVCK